MIFHLFLKTRLYGLLEYIACSSCSSIGRHNTRVWIRVLYLQSDWRLGYVVMLDYVVDQPKLQS